MEISEATEHLTILVKQGDIWAKCPICTIPLSFKEFKQRKCLSCGKFHFNDIKFYPKINQC